MYFKDLPGYAGTHRGRIPENQSSLASAAVCPLLLETLSAHLCVLAKERLVLPTGYLCLPLISMWPCRELWENLHWRRRREILYPDQNFHSSFLENILPFHCCCYGEYYQSQDQDAETPDTIRLYLTYPPTLNLLLDSESNILSRKTYLVTN